MSEFESMTTQELLAWLEEDLYRDTTNVSEVHAALEELDKRPDSPMPGPIDTEAAWHRFVRYATSIGMDGGEK